jgi:hypothetical protein
MLSGRFLSIAQACGMKDMLLILRLGGFMVDPCLIYSLVLPRVDLALR